MTDLGTIPGYDAVGMGINDAGQIVGNLTPQQGTGSLGFIYRDGAMTILPTLDAGTSWCCSGSARTINNSGQVAGSSGASSQPGSVAVIYTNGVPVALPVPPSSSVRGLNDYGQATGYDAAAGSGFVFSDGVATYPFVSPTLTPWGSSSSGEAMNNAAQVAGTYTITIDDLQPNTLLPLAFLYANGVAQLLPVFGSPNALTSSEAKALDINNAGQVVGESGESGLPTSQSAYLYANGQMIDLNTVIDVPDPLAPFVHVINIAIAINDNGWIVAHGPTRHARGAADLIRIPGTVASR